MDSRFERGSALVVALVALVIVAGVAAAFCSVENSRHQSSQRLAERERAYPIAESGVDTVAVLLNANAWTATSLLEWSSDGVDNDGDGKVDEGDETLVATAQLWGSDGIDNDGDAEIDEPDEAIARVSCMADVGTSTARVTGWLRRSNLLLPEPVAAVYLHDPLAQCSFAGNAFTVSGNDQNMNGTPGPMPSLHGIAINGDPQQVITQLGSQQTNNVSGLGGMPSVTSYTSYPPNFIQDVVAQLSPLANPTLNNYQGTYTGNLGNWQTGQFQITLANGNFEIGGGSTGAGILLVNGDLKISGGWDFYGYVFVTGNVTMTGGGSMMRLHGALFVEGNVLQPASSATMGGTVEIHYSSEALTQMQAAFGRYAIVAISEP